MSASATGGGSMGLMAHRRALVVGVEDLVGTAVVRRLAAEGARVRFTCGDAARSTRLIERARGFDGDVQRLPQQFSLEATVRAILRVEHGLDLLVLIGARDGLGEDVGRIHRALSASHGEGRPMSGVTVIARQRPHRLRSLAAQASGVRLLGFDEIGLVEPLSPEECAAAVVMAAGGQCPTRECEEEVCRT